MDLSRKRQAEAVTPGEPGAAPLREGYLVAEKYGLIEPLGTGSMGSVWKATHVMLGHTVAIKFLHASVEAYPDGRVRFEREAKLCARLGDASRHICRVSDFGVIASTPFVVMELLRGEELSARIRRERVLPLPLIVEVVTQLCRALTVAHEAGVIHRDLKPANVFLCVPEDGDEVRVKLLDFGVAKAALEHEDTQGTRAGTIFGTPGYMSPEQIIADTELDPRSDLWSVAVMTYRMAVGRTPFGSGNLSELGMRILTTTPHAPSSLRPELPKRFDEWMKKALAKRREERFSSAAELASSLVEALSRSGTDSAPIDLGPEDIVAIDEPGPASDAAYSAPIEPGRRRLRLGIVAGAVGFTVAVTLVVAVISQRKDPAEHQRAETSAASLPVTSKPKVELAHEAPAPPPVEIEPVIVAPSATAPPAIEEKAPRASTARSLAKPVTRPPKTSAEPSNIEKQAGELWNKKDEL